MRQVFSTSDPHVFRVQSFTNPHIAYVVRIPKLAQLWPDEATCSCPDQKSRHRVCKHILAVVVHLCEQAPLQIHLGGGRFYAREPHEMAFWSLDRHSWAHVSVPRVLTMTEKKEVLQPAPHWQAVIKGLRAQLLDERKISHAVTLLDQLYQGHPDGATHPACPQDAGTPVEACPTGA